MTKTASFQQGTLSRWIRKDAEHGVVNAYSSQATMGYEPERYCMNLQCTIYAMLYLKIAV